MNDASVGHHRDCQPCRRCSEELATLVDLRAEVERLRDDYGRHTRMIGATIRLIANLEGLAERWKRIEIEDGWQSYSAMDGNDCARELLETVGQMPASPSKDL